ncbi:MAG: TauD/TfdA family dioxygenase [Ilumatobacteraceae bacterium]
MSTATTTTAAPTTWPDADPRRSFDLTPITPSIGAEVDAIDLNDALDDATMDALRDALVRYKVLVFRHQDITPAAHVALARRFGELEIHPVFPHHPDHPELVLLGGSATSKATENIYHSDVSWRANPSMASLLRCIECPPAGGDTIWVNMALAYENLPASMKAPLTQLEALHDLMPAFGSRMTPEQRDENRRTYPPMAHPVVRTHPESGERILYVNEAFTTHLANYSAAFEPRVGSDFKVAEMDLLQYLLRQATIPEYQMRLRWEPDTLVIWDNRSTQHYAIQDYFPAVRRMMRATVIGDRPR